MSRLIFSSATGSWRCAATRSSSRGSGWPIRQWKRSSSRRSVNHDQARHPLPAPLALLHHRQIRRAYRRCLDHALHSLPSGVVMTRERLYLFDTTLRDGAQTNGVDFTLSDKLAIAQMLDDLGIDYVEGGYPGANPT